MRQSQVSSPLLLLLAVALMPLANLHLVRRDLCIPLLARAAVAFDLYGAAKACTEGHSTLRRRGKIRRWRRLPHVAEHAPPYDRTWRGGDLPIAS